MIPNPDSRAQINGDWDDQPIAQAEGGREVKPFKGSGILSKVRDKLREHKEKRKDPEYRKETRENITICLLIITTAAVVWQISEMIKVYRPIKTQADAALIQAQAAKAAEDQQLRAYLYVDHNSTHITGSHVDMDTLIHFAGATPAYEVWFKGIIKIADSDKNLGNVWHMDGVTERHWPAFFGSTPRTVNISANFSRDEIRAMKQKGQRFYVFGSVCHITNLNERRQYNFCFSFDSDGKAEDGQDMCQTENPGTSQPECPTKTGWEYKHKVQSQ
jgi:hypothetical protein